MRIFSCANPAFIVRLYLDVHCFVSFIDEYQSVLIENSFNKYGKSSQTLYEPRYEKTGFLHMRKQRRRSASRLLRS